MAFFLAFSLIALCMAWDQKSLVREINSRNDVTWVAGLNPHFEDFTIEDFRRLNGARPTPMAERNYREAPSVSNVPDEFDSRTNWPDCTSIGKIYDQGHCGSCWAMSSFEVLQDRFCIKSKGVQSPELSAQHLTSCTPGCSGCNGGWMSTAFSYMQNSGIVTEGCIPYQMGTCKHPGCSTWATPKCNKTCYPDTKAPFETDKWHAQSSYSVRSSESEIQKEILENGPVTASFAVYEDLAVYQSGVYQHVSGGFEGLHAIKIVGWGVLDGTKYWTIVNSWNTDWGFDGLLLIRRGNDECGIESDVVAGQPKLK